MKRMLTYRVDVPRLLAVVLSWSMSIVGQSQLVVNTSQAPATLVQNVILGGGVFASNVIFNGAPGANFPPGPDIRIGRFNGTNSNLGLANGVLLHSGDVSYVPGPNDQEVVGAGGWVPDATPDADLAQLAQVTGWQLGSGSLVYNKADLQFDFIPLYDMVRFRYVFSSEEYERWTCLPYNDAFGFFLSGPGINGPFSNNAINLALVPGTLTPVGVNTVNSGMVANNANGGNVLDPFAGCFAIDSSWFQNTQYYIYNGSWVQGLLGGAQTETPYCCDPYYIQHNGLTVVLEATAAVKCGEQYRIKMAIADIGDFRVPSAVYIEQGSFTSTDRFRMDVAPGPNVEIIAGDTTFIESSCDSVYLRFHRMGGFYLDEDLLITVSGTSTPGVDYMPELPTLVHFDQFDSTVVIPIAVPLDADGPEDLVITIVTCDGLKLQTYIYTIDQRPPLEVELEDQEAFCPGSFTLTPEVSGGSNDPANWTYLWSTGETTPSIVVEVEESTQYWVTVSDSCWAEAVTDSAWVLIPDYVPMALDVTPDTAVACLGFADVGVVASGGAGGYTYEWTSNGNVVGTTDSITVPASLGTVYVVEVTDQCGQVALDSLTVTTGPTPPLVITAVGDTVMCAGMPMVLQVVSVSGGGGTYSYEWGVPPGTVPVNNPTLEVTVNDDSYFTVTVRDECGNVADTTLAAIVQDFDPLVITVSGDTIVCPGEPVVLWVEVEGGAGGYTISWPGIGSGSPVTWTAVPGGIDALVSVSDACGITVNDTVSVAVYPASVRIDPRQDADLTWTFTAISDPSTGNDLEWDLGDGTSATGTTVTHTYEEPDAYWVILYMTTAEGCVAVDSVRTRPPSGTIYFPNAFTPNGDGYNDTFGGAGVLIDKYELLVFDRWGRVLFESTDMTVRWNGRSSDGEEVMDGVYQYRYRVSGLGLPMKQGFGHVTLLR
jgi:gliding motility-associated-like protein